MNICPIHNKQIYEAAFDQKKEFVSKEPTLWIRIANSYSEAIKKFVDFLYKNNWEMTSMVLGTLLIETGPALRAGFSCPASWKNHFNYYDMNPKVVTSEKSKQRPILLIHGNYHNQSAWLSLSKKLKYQNLGPVFTVNLPNGALCDKDFEITHKKINEIKELYNKLGMEDIKIDLIGHSRGGIVSTCLSTGMYVESLSPNNHKEGRDWGSLKDTIGKVITIGNATHENGMNFFKKFNPEYLVRRYEIIGKYDILTTNPSLLDQGHQITVETGHLGLLYSPETHKQVISWLKS